MARFDRLLFNDSPLGTVNVPEPIAELLVAVLTALRPIEPMLVVNPPVKELAALSVRNPVPMPAFWSPSLRMPKFPLMTWLKVMVAVVMNFALAASTTGERMVEAAPVLVVIVGNVPESVTVALLVPKAVYPVLKVIALTLTPPVA